MRKKVKKLEFVSIMSGFVMVIMLFGIVGNIDLDRTTPVCVYVVTSALGLVSFLSSRYAAALKGCEEYYG